MNNIEKLTKALELYDGVNRRGSNPYVQHPLNMLGIAENLGWIEDKLQMVVALHDILEVTDVTIDTLIKEFKLDDEQVEALNLLTVQVGESSNQHFERVLNSSSILALRTKYVDCIDNSIMSDADLIWYRDVYGKDASEEKNKYLHRAKLVSMRIGNLLT